MSRVSYSCDKQRSTCFSFCLVPLLALLTFTCDPSLLQSLPWTYTWPSFHRECCCHSCRELLLQTTWNFCTKKLVDLNHYLLETFVQLCKERQNLRIALRDRATSLLLQSMRLSKKVTF